MRFLYATFICAFFLLNSNKANAVIEARPYVGGSFTKYKTDYTENNGISYKGLIPSSYTGYGFFFGLEMSEFFNLEFGYDLASAGSLDSHGAYGLDSVGSRLTTMRYDAIVKLPLNSFTKVLLIGGLIQGVNSTSIQGNEVDGRFKQGGYSTGYEYGFGLMRDYDDIIFTKFEYRKQVISYGGIANGAQVYSFGIGFKLA